MKTIHAPLVSCPCEAVSTLMTASTRDLSSRLTVENEFDQGICLFRQAIEFANRQLGTMEYRQSFFWAVGWGGACLFLISGMDLSKTAKGFSESGRK